MLQQTKVGLWLVVVFCSLLLTVAQGYIFHQIDQSVHDGLSFCTRDIGSPLISIALFRTKTSNCDVNLFIISLDWLKICQNCHVYV